MSKEERLTLETLAYSYFIIQGLLPDDAKRKVGSLTDEQLEEFAN